MHNVYDPSMPPASAVAGSPVAGIDPSVAGAEAASYAEFHTTTPPELPPQRAVKLRHDDLEIPRCEVWGVPFDRVSLPEAVEVIETLVDRREPSYIITANVNYVMLHHQDPTLHRITEDADLVLADGQPIVWRSQLDDQELPERVAGSDLIFEIAHRAAARGWNLYLLGGEEGVAETCAAELVRRNPGLKIVGAESPPFRRLSAREQVAQDQRIRAAGTDVLLVAFGQPKGERWIHEHYQRLGVPVSIQLGASFDFVAGTATRAPSLWQKLGLEWFYRMCRDPKRLASRYWENGKFLFTQIRDEAVACYRSRS